MMMNPNILNKNLLMFFDRAVNAQRSQLLQSWLKQSASAARRQIRQPN